MDLSSLKPTEGSTKNRKRVGRGRASGHGKTSTRGQKGQKSRTSVRVGFEGGQMPLTRRVPKLPGFKNNNKEYFELINIAKLDAFDAKSVVNPDALFEKGLIRKPTLPVKVLGVGDMTKAMTVEAHAFSKTAREKIEAAGGEAKVI